MDSNKKFETHSSEMLHIFKIDDLSYHYYTSELKDLILRDEDKENHVR